MNWYIVGVIGVILVSGAFGGYAGSLLNLPDGEHAQRGRASWVWRNIVLGIVAAMMVPLFLKLARAIVDTEGDLMRHIVYPDGTHGPELWLVFAGLCLVAAVSAQKFIVRISNAVLERRIDAVDQKAEAAQTAAATANQQAAAAKNEAQVAKAEARDAQEIAEEAGDDKSAAGRPELEAAEPQVALADVPLPKQIQVLRGVAAAGRRPSPEDIQATTGMSLDEVRNALAVLQRNGLVQRRNDAPDGTQRWRIRTEGKELLESLHDGGASPP